MLSIPFLLVPLLLTTSIAYAATNFRGVTASNSISGAGTSTYTCRTQVQWNKLANDLKSGGFQSLRIVGFDTGTCNALDMASSAASAAGITVLAGIFYSGPVSSSNGSIDTDVQAFINAIRKFGAARYIGLTVGNEVADSPANIMNKVNQVRSTLRSAGINTPVSTAHNWVTVHSSSLFCQGDFVGANAHGFYDGNVKSVQAGDFVFKIVVPALKSLCPGKQIIITESGWPSRGNTNGAAVASINDERNALSSINCACRSDRSVSVFAFEYDDQNWKKNNEDERSFGVFGKFDLAGDVFSTC